MLKNAIWLVLLAGISLRASQIPGFSLNHSASLRGDGTGQVMPRQNTPASQLSTSEADHRAVFAAGITSIGSSAALESVWAAGEGWQLVLTCVGMAAFVLLIIWRRLRHAKRLGTIARPIERAGH